MAFNAYNVLKENQLYVQPQLDFIFEELGRSVQRALTKK